MIDAEGKPVKGRVLVLPEFEWPVATDPGALVEEVEGGFYEHRLYPMATAPRAGASP